MDVWRSGTCTMRVHFIIGWLTRLGVDKVSSYMDSFPFPCSPFVLTSYRSHTNDQEEEEVLNKSMYVCFAR